MIRAPALRQGGAVVVLIVLSWGCGCGHLSDAFGQPHCPVQWVRSEALAGHAGLRARMSLHVHDHEVNLEVVARHLPDRLAVVGLTPYGIRLFAVTQREGPAAPKVEADSVALRRLAVFVMDALHRVFWIGPEVAGAETTDGAVFAWGTERIEEAVGSDGRRRRLFRDRRSSADVGVTIDYPSPSAAEGTTIEVINDWCGYEAIIAPFEPAGQTGATPRRLGHDRGDETNVTTGAPAWTNDRRTNR